MLLVISMTLALEFSMVVTPTVRAQAAGSIPELVLTVHAGNGDNLVFVPDSIRIPQVPIILNVTVINNGTGTVGLHTFSIRDSGGVPRIDLRLPILGSRGTVRFQVNESRTAPGASGDVFYNGTAFAPERGTAGVRFYCAPHEAAGMVGQIVLATVSVVGPEEKGIFLRAYWIGVIALGAMIVWTGITYFVIKASSRRFTDHHEHIRRGLP